MHIRLPTHKFTFYALYTIKQSNIKIALPMPTGMGRAILNVINSLRYGYVINSRRFHGQGMGRFERKLNTFDRPCATGNPNVYIFVIFLNILGQTKTLNSECLVTILLQLDPINSKLQQRFAVREVANF